MPPYKAARKGQYGSSRATYEDAAEHLKSRNSEEQLQSIGFSVGLMA